MFGRHIFDRVCEQHSIQHKFTKPYHPWTNGQAERMNRTVKEATVKALHYPDLECLKAHVLAFVSAYNFAKHLKALRWKTPSEAMCQAWTTTPDIFKLNPRHLILGPNTFIVPPRSSAVPSDTTKTAPKMRDRHMQIIAERGRMAWRRTLAIMGVLWFRPTSAVSSWSSVTGYNREQVSAERPRSRLPSKR